jgi:uncharacterized protein (DUF169 family)
MTTPQGYNKHGEELEKFLKSASSPVAVKMLESEADVPPEAVRPKLHQGYHPTHRQAFRRSRRDKETTAKRAKNGPAAEGYYFPLSCAYAVVTVMKTGEYNAVLPDSGEYARTNTMGRNISSNRIVQINKSSLTESIICPSSRK